MGGRNGKGGPATPHAFSEALLFATMCIVGLPVEVQVKDGSVYSGIFHTASVEKEYGIALKKARMIVKGRCKGNLGIGTYIDTLVVHSEDLVQVIARGVLLPAEGTVVDAEGDGVEAVTGPIQSPPCDAVPPRNVDQDGESTATHFLKASHFDANAIGMPLGRTLTTKTSETAYEAENGKGSGMCPEKVVVASHVPIISVSERQAGECKSKEEQVPCSNAYVTPWEKAILPGNCSSNSSTDVYLAQVNFNGDTDLDISTKIMLDETCCSTPVTTLVKVNSDSGMATSRTISPSNVHTANHSTSTVHAKTMSCPSSSEMSILSTSPRNLTSNTGTKEFKLNPRAKTFSPSFANPRTVVPAVSTVASIGYVPNTYTVVPIATAQPGIDIRPSANCTSAQTKFIQHINIPSGNTGHVSQFSHPIMGLTGTRHQPPRLSGQYNPVQTGPTYLFPNSQIVTIGRRGQVMYLHPVSQDSIHGIPTFTQAPPHPLLAPYPTNLPKPQGSATPHFCVTQPIFPAGQQLPTMPIQIPYSNPLPSIQAIHVPGGSNIFASKF